MKPSILLFALLALVGCSSPQQPVAEQPKSTPVVVPPPAAEPDNRKVLLVVGDSISAGYGLAPGLSYPDVMQHTLDEEKLPWHVVNQGVSGDTTAGGAARIQAGLDTKPSVVLLELGGNDGLRGLPLTATKDSLEKMILAYKGAGAQVVLAGMSLPPNYGPDYIKDFEKLYKDLATKHKVKLIPFLLVDMITPDLRFFQQDGIHPTEEGAKLVAKTALATLRPLLK